MKKIRLEIDEEQLKILSSALDLYTSLGILQWEELLNIENVWFNDKITGTDFNVIHENKEMIVRHIEAIKRILFSTVDSLKDTEAPLHVSLGIGSEEVSEKTQLAYEIYKSLCHYKWKEQDPLLNKFSVHSDEGLKFTEHDRPKVWTKTVKDERKEKLQKITKKI